MNLHSHVGISAVSWCICLLSDDDSKVNMLRKWQNVLQHTRACFTLNDRYGHCLHQASLLYTSSTTIRQNIYDDRILPFYLLGPLFYDTWTTCCFQDFRLTNIVWDSEILLLMQWKGSKKWMKGFWMSCTQFTEEQKSEFWFLDCMQINGLLFSKIKQAVLLSLWWHSLKYRK